MLRAVLLTAVGVMPLIGEEPGGEVRRGAATERSEKFWGFLVDFQGESGLDHQASRYPPPFGSQTLAHQRPRRARGAPASHRKEAPGPDLRPTRKRPGPEIRARIGPGKPRAREPLRSQNKLLIDRSKSTKPKDTLQKPTSENPKRRLLRSTQTTSHKLHQNFSEVATLGW